MKLVDITRQKQVFWFVCMFSSPTTKLRSGFRGSCTFREKVFIAQSF